MKRFKYIITILLSLACMFSTFGCAKNNKAYIVDNSLSWKVNTHYFDTQINYVNVYFDVFLPTAENCEVSYTLHFYYYGEEISTKDVKHEYSTRGTKSISDTSWYIRSADYADKVWDGYVTDEKMAEVRVKDFKVTYKKSLTKYRSFAIGFGVTGGALLLGMIALFVVLKIKGGKAEN